MLTTFFRVAAWRTIFFRVAAFRTTFFRVAAFRTIFFRVAVWRTTFFRVAAFRTTLFRVAAFRVTFFRVAFFRTTLARVAAFLPTRAVGASSSSRSIPNIADRSSPARASSSAGGGSASVDTRSVGSTLRSRNNCSGSVSSRTPTPYRTAATCLHISAQSGQEQPSSISFGAGKSPSPGRVTISMTRRGGLPSSNSTSDSISPAHSPRIASQRFFGSGRMPISTS